MDDVEAQWRKSSFSDGNSDCVEVAHRAELVGIRDSKNTAGPALTLPARGWQALLTTL